MKASSPIFIGGLFKSGTSLLRAMLGQHSHIASGLETYWFDLDWYRPRDKAFDGHIERLRCFFEFDKAEMTRIVARSSDVYDFLDSLFGTYADRLGKPRWCEKTPGNVLHMDRIFQGWPDARMIHLMRDPFDAYTSMKRTRGQTVQEFAELWCRFFGAAERHKRALTLDGRHYLEVRYEDLVFDTEGTMRRILVFLDEPWEKSVTRFEGKPDDFTKVIKVTGKASPTLDRLRKPLTDKCVGVWRSALSESETKGLDREVAERGYAGLFAKVRAGASPD